MKILFVFLFSFTLFAQVSKPAKMYDHTTILENYFRPLRNYVVKLKQLYPYNEFENEMVFYNESNLYSHFQIQLISINEKQYELIFFSENQNIDIIEFTFNNEITLTLKKLLDLSFVRQLENDEYTIAINSRVSTFKSEIIGQSRMTQYVLGANGTTAYLEELNTLNYYESTLFYRCPNCGGEILRAQFTPQTEMYYRGLDQIRVNDTDFFNRANRFYLSGILRGMSQLISSRTNNHIWPEVQ